MGIFDEDAVAAEEYLDANEIEAIDEAMETGAGEPAGEAPAPEVGLAEDGLIQPGGEEPPEATETPTGVPLQELLYERRRRQDLESQLNEQGQMLASLNNRLQTSMQASQQRQLEEQRKQAEAERPDPEEDPIGFQNWKIQQLENQLGGLGVLARQGMDMQKSMVAQNEQQALVTQSQNMQTQFANNNPDYWEAYNHLAKTRMAEIQAMGYSGQQAEQMLEQDKSMIVTSCMDRDPQGNFKGWKQNPAEVVYNIARQRGFQGVSAGQQTAAVQQVRTLAEGQRAAAGNSGASGEQVPIGLDNLSKMSDAEFDAFQRKHPGVVEQLLGG